MKISLNAFLKVANVIVGPILAATGVPTALIPIVQHGIQDAEIASAKRDVPLTGAEKKALVLDSLATGIAGANAAKPGSVDPNVTILVSRGIDLTVDTINAIHKPAPTVTADGSVVSILD